MSTVILLMASKVEHVQVEVYFLLYLQLEI